MSEHTKGPWRYEPISTCGAVYHGSDYRMEVCRVNGRDGEQQANARLIAAAPQLLEACEAYHAWMTADFDTVADWFYRDTGIMRPGKDSPPGCAGHSYEERRDAWEAWLKERKAELARNAESAIRAAREG